MSPDRQAGQPGQAGTAAPGRRPSSSSVSSPCCSSQSSRPGVDAAAAGGHDQAFQRREAHRGVDADARRGRRPATRPPEMTGDDPQPVAAAGRATGRPGGRRTRATARGTRTAAARTGRPLAGQGIGGGGGRQPGVEGGIEAGDGGHVPAAAARAASMAARARGLCSGARSVSVRDGRDAAVVDQRGPGEMAAAVHDPVADHVDARRWPRRKSRSSGWSGLPSQASRSSAAVHVVRSVNHRA